ncbi:MAG: hypothetical protein AAB393_19995, partial [Bacteroidota bacterium]
MMRYIAMVALLFSWSDWVFSQPNIQSARIGFSMKVQVDNRGVFGRQAFPGGDPPQSSGLIGMEYPAGEPYEHLFGTGVWIGGILDTARSGPPVYHRGVSVVYEGWSGPHFEFNPGDSPADTIFRISGGKNPPKPAAWDEHFGVGYPFRPITDDLPYENFFMKYSDVHSRRVAGHVPMNLRIIEACYAWSNPYADAIMIVEYTIVNFGRKIIDSAYVGFFYEADVGPISAPLYWTRNFTGYYPNSRTGYVHNPVDRGSTPSGVALLSTSKSLDSLRYSFNWFPGPQTPPDDRGKYALMSSGNIRRDEFPSLSDTRFVFSFGPFFIKPSGADRDTVRYPRGDTLKIAVAILSGYDPAGNHLRALQRNASRALDIYLNQGIQLPKTPPSPPLRIEVGFRKVTLNWRWTPADSVGPNGRKNPELNWDSTNQVSRRYPDRIDPPFEPGVDPLRGGRNFSAYKIWRSEHPGTFNFFTNKWDPPPDNSYTLIRQIDVPTDSFEYNIGRGPGPNGEYHFDGLQPDTFVDSNLVRGNVYWYAVTSKSIPNLAYQQIVIGGQVVTVEVPVDPLES